MQRADKADNSTKVESLATLQPRQRGYPLAWWQVYAVNVGSKGGIVKKVWVVVFESTYKLKRKGLYTHKLIDAELDTHKLIRKG